MKKTIVFMIGIALSTTMLSACSSDPSVKIAENEAAVSKIKQEALQQREEHQQGRLEDEVAATPGWALHPPRPDGVGVYGVGFANSATVDDAFSQAKVKAEFELAKVYNKELTGREKIFRQDTGGDSVMSHYQRIIDELVKASIVGDEIVKQKIKPLHGRVYAWVLLKLPYAEFNQMIKEKKMQTNDQTVRDAFDQLERRLDKRREQNRQDGEAKATESHAGEDGMQSGNVNTPVSPQTQLSYPG